MSVQIVWPEVDELTTAPSVSYLDVHGVLSRCQDRVVAAIKTNKKPRNILLNSKHGLGKTLMAATLVHNLRTSLGKKIPFVVFDCSEDTKEYHMKGSYTVQPDGTTAFVPGPIPLVIEMANRTGLAVLCLEEMSALTPGAQKIINSITDWRTGVYVPQIGRFIKLHEGCNVVILGTMNPTVYGGVYSLNADLRSRFVEEVVPWPTMEQERTILKSICQGANGDVIERVIQLGKDSRSPSTEYNLSTRDLVTLVDEITDLPNSLESVLMCVVNKFEGSERDLIADRVDAIFATKLKKKISA